MNVARFLGLSALLLSPLAAQQPRSSRIAGVVAIARDGHPMVDVPVVLSCAGQAPLNTRTDAEGRFAFDRIAPNALCSVSARPQGFVEARRENVSTTSGELRLLVDIEAVRSTIIVAAAAEALRSNAPEISQTIHHRQLSELPSGERNLNKFALLNPHVRYVLGLGADSTAGARISVNASSFRQTSHTVDGTINYDFALANGPQQTFSVAAVEQFKVLSNQYSSEYGTSSSGIFSVVTKAGTSDYHGELYAFLRPSGIQAAPPVSTFRVPNQRYVTGGLLSGPIVRDRTHFFVSLEKAAQERGSFIQSPTPRFFTGVSDDKYALARLDHRFSDSHSLSLRGNAHHSNTNNANDAVSGFTQPSAAQYAITQAAAFQATDSIATSSMANEFRFGYTNYVPYYNYSLSPQPAVVRPNYSTEGSSAVTNVRSQNFHLSDLAIVHRGTSTWRFGGDYMRLKSRDYSVTPFGTYTFAPGPPVPGERPVRYTQTFGAADLHYGQTMWDVFVQNDWRLRPNVTANLGLRYERQSITTDRNNLAPRLGLAWDVKGDGRTTVRAGAGMFYDPYYFIIVRRFYQLGLNAPTATYTIPYGAPGFPVFPATLTAPPAGIDAGRRDIFIRPDSVLNPYNLQYSIGLQQLLANDWVLTVDAMHSHTLKMMRARDLNAPAPFLRTAPGQRRTAAEADATRPLKEINGVPVRNVIVTENSSSSIYDALDFGLLKRFGARHRVEVHYVASSSTQYSMFFGEQTTGLPNDWSNTGSAERGPSDFHQRHRVVANGYAGLPSGMQLAAILTLASGLPVNPVTGIDNNSDTNLLDRPAGFGRNSFRTPAHASLDVNLAKQFHIREHLRIEFRAEAFNVLNRNNYIKVNSVYGDGAAPLPTFLRPIAGIQNADPSRQIQAGLRLLF